MQYKWLRTRTRKGGSGDPFIVFQKKTSCWVVILDRLDLLGDPQLAQGNLCRKSSDLVILR
jgi:hypothetical protein